MEKQELTMMDPPIDEIHAKVGNKYKMTCLVGKRAKELASRYYAQEPSDVDPKVIAIASQEVMSGEVVSDK